MVLIPFAQVFAFKTTTNPAFLLALAGAILAVFLLQLYKKWSDSRKPSERKRKGAMGHGTATAAAGPQKPDRGDLRYVIRTYGFSKDQADFFTRLCNGSHIANPSKLLQSESDFNDFCTRTFNYLQAQGSTNKMSEKYKTLLFTIRESVEQYRKTAKQVTSTRDLRGGQQLTLTTGTDEQYPSTIVENTHQGLLCAVPRDIFGNELRVPVGSKLKIFFYTPSNDSYQLMAKVKRYESAKNATLMLLTHSDSVSAMPSRNHERRAIDSPCTFSSVTVANVVNGKRTEHKFYPSGKPIAGTLQDISAGGCSVRTATPLNEGSYLELKCQLDSLNEEIIIAKTVKLHKAETDGEYVMHIQFAKIPRSTMNRIFSYIYDYGDR